MIRKQYFDWANIVLGLWLIVAPWVFGFALRPAAMWSSVFLGLAVIGVAAWALTRPAHRGSEWMAVALGVLLFLAPWATGYSGLEAAAWDAWVVGLVVAVLAGLPRMPGVQRVLVSQ